MSNLCTFEDISKAILKTPDSAIKWLETLCGENVKWKHTANANQMVVRTDNYYYKVYAYNEVDKFNSLIRHAFAQVYQSYGIKWDIITVKTESGYIDVERREKLETCKEWSDDILINYSDTLDLVEEKLNFEGIKNEIKKQYKFINKLKLVRQCVNRPKDYAIYDNKIILLDDADWHLVMLDFYNRPIGMSNIFVKVKVFDEYYTFTSLIINPQRVLTIESVYDFRDKFFLFKDLELIKRNASLRQEFHNMIKDNINLLIHKETKQYNSERKELCSIFKKTFYCTDNYDGIDFNTYNKIALNINDINNNKSIWDMACYYYTNQDICAIDLYSSLYSNIDYLCNLLDEAKICAVDPIAGFEKNTGIFIYTQFNILNDNNVLNNNIEYLKKHYPDIKIIINVILVSQST